jgi:parallel beta-helix repeat protein
MRWLPVASFALVLAGSAAVARADTLNVPSDDYPTIQSAVDAAAAGDVILVSAGVYAETITILEKTGVTLKGKGYPTIQPGDGNGIIIDSSAQIVVSGFEVYQAVNGVFIGSSEDVSVSKMVVSGSTQDAFNLSGNLGVLVSKCEVNGTGDDGVEDSDSEDVTVEKCSFTGISDSVMYLSTINLPGNGSDRAKVVKNRIEGANNGILLGGADLLVEKNRVSVSNLGIYVESSTGPTDGVITKNVVSTEGTTGIYVSGTDFEIAGNSLAGGGIQVFGSGHVIDRNKVAGSSVGVNAVASGVTVTRNQVRDCSGDGILVPGNYVSVEGNKVQACAGRGIVVAFSGDGPIAGNRVSDCNGRGFEISGSGNTLTGNKSTNNDTIGFYVTGTGNTFTGNRASGNGTIDLADTNAEGVNTYTGNKFGTQQIPYTE